MGQNKSGSKAPDEKDYNKEVDVARNGITGTWNVTPLGGKSLS